MESPQLTYSAVILSTFWGKLAIGDNKPAMVFIKDPHKFYSAHYNVTSFDLINEDVLQLSYILHEDFVETNPKTDLVLAAKVQSNILS